jgi:hypothetical protein
MGERTIIICIILLVILVGACDVRPGSDKLTEQDLFGEYVPTYEYGLSEKIILLPESIYVHCFTSPENIEYADTSTWELHYEMNDSTMPRILLRDFIDRYPLDGHEVSQSPKAVLDTLPKNWRPYVNKSSENIVIERSASFYQFYKKTN